MIILVHIKYKIKYKFIKSIFYSYPTLLSYVIHQRTANSLSYFVKRKVKYNVHQMEWPTQIKNRSHGTFVNFIHVGLVHNTEPNLNKNGLKGISFYPSSNRLNKFKNCNSCRSCPNYNSNKNQNDSII